MRIGVDTGGTFTDLVMLDEGRIRVHKVRSTPDDPSRAILQGILELAGRRDVSDVAHGSTVATNAVLERRGACVALVTTGGFEDVLRIGRQTRRELYNIMVEDRRPLVEPALTFGIRERMTAEGDILIPIDRAEIERLAAELKERRVDAVAVCLLHSYRNSSSEELVEKCLSDAGLVVSSSHRVLREYREFERWSTTVLNAYVTPLMARYLGTLETKLGSGSRLRIMQSNGGSISASAAKASAVQTILSGPAAGVVGARAVAEAAGFSRIISFDMGGTSTDVSLIDGAIGVTTESTVGDFPMRLPIIDIHTVGAGGGSITYVDTGGALKVGPRSAGADPGPVCYGKGTELTVTDANLILGRLDPSYFLGGRMPLDMERTKAATREFAAKLGMSDLALAEGIIRIANANMERAIRVVSVQRGFDPRDFALLAFGGAGGMHACEIAEKLDISTVIAPKDAGVLSALGTLLADVTKDFSMSILRPVGAVSGEELDQLYAPLVSQATQDLQREGFDDDHIGIEQSLDVRYIGQSYEITVPYEPSYREEFDTHHARLYGYANPRRATEIVNLRVKAIGLTSKPELPRLPGKAVSQIFSEDMRHAYFNRRRFPTAFLRWDALEPGAEGTGPAIIAGAEATTVIPPNFRFRIDEFGNIIATRTGELRSRKNHG